MFQERELLVMQYSVDEEITKTTYHSMLKDDILEFVSFSGCKTQNDMVEKAREQEIELDLKTKWKLEQVQAAIGQAKKPKTSDPSSRGQQGHGLCSKCGNPYSGSCLVAGSADCPRLDRGGGAVEAHAPATLRIVDGHPIKADAAMVKSCTFQLTTEEARAAPDGMTATFVVNGLSAQILFDSEANRSFVSFAFNKKFDDVPGTLDSPLEVEIVDNLSVSATRVFQSSVLNMFGERFPIDLVQIPLRGLKVIVRMNWLLD
ncbi:hypothetical protein Lser_V15G14296 [Lactuca serriola]